MKKYVFYGILSLIAIVLLIAIIKTLIPQPYKEINKQELVNLQQKLKYQQRLTLDYKQAAANWERLYNQSKNKPVKIIIKTNEKIDSVRGLDTSAAISYLKKWSAKPVPGLPTN